MTELRGARTMPVARVRFPVAMMDAVRAMGARDGMGHSTAVRLLVARGLTAEGLWPPAEVRRVRE